MAIFEGNIVQNNTSVGTIASLIWNPENTSSTTFGPLGSVSSTAVLKDVTIVNTGTVNVYVGSGSAAAATTTGLLLPVGGQVTIQGYSLSNPTGALGQIWGNVGTVGSTGSTKAGLASVASVV